MDEYTRPRTNCTCKECARAKLNPEPSDLQFHQLRRARETGKVKNPPWYKCPSMPAPFKPQLSQKYPSWCMPARALDPWLDPVGRFYGTGNHVETPKGETTAEYVASFDRLMHFKSCAYVQPEEAEALAA